MSNKKPKPPKKIKPHKNKYSGNFIGNKEKSMLENMLYELKELDDFQKSEDYQNLKLIKENTREYYQRVRILYFKYF